MLASPGAQLQARRSLRGWYAARAAPAQRGAARQPCTTCVLKLYTNPRSRGRIIEWFLQEVGVQYQAVNVDFEKQEHKSDWYLKINPLGKLPAIEDGGFTLWESGALLLYVAERYGGVRSAQDRAVAAQWVLFANSTMGNAIFVEQFRAKQMPVVMDALEAQLAGQPYLLGDDLTVADVAVGGYLLYIPMFFPQQDLSAWPNVQQYMQRLMARPACQATVAQRVEQGSNSS